MFFQGNLERVDRSSERISADYLNQRRSSDETNTALLVDEVDIRNRSENRDRYGLSLMLDYRLPMGTIQWTNFVNRLDRSYVSRDNTYNPSESGVTYDIRDAQLQTDVFSSALSAEFNLADLATLDVTANRSTSEIEHAL